MRTLTLFLAAAVFSSVTQPINAQGNDQLAAIQQKLKDHIILAALDGNGDIATAGSVVTLQKSGLQMCATTLPAAAGAPGNTYKNGKISAGMFAWRLGLGILMIDPNTIPMRTLVSGEKLWIVHYNVNKNGIELKLWTDPDSNNIRYYAWLGIPFNKKQIPSPDEVMNALSEVLAVEPGQGQSALTGPAPPLPAQHVYEDLAPPPPPPAPAPTISVGQTRAQVSAAFGEPQRKAAAGPKEIFFYTDLKMKVTFINGKVSGIE
jgi:hypothetical protein